MSGENLENVLARYPLEQRAGDHSVLLRTLTRGDDEALLAFARALPEHELLFLRRDITEASEVAAWIEDCDRADFYTLLAIEADAVVGYVVVDRSPLRWSRHVAELRILLGPALRGLGLGREMTREAFRIAAAMGVEKVVAQMTTDQTGAMTIFHNLGFENEAVLQRHAKDRDGNVYDLMVMRRWVDPAEVAAIFEQS